MLLITTNFGVAKLVNGFDLSFFPVFGKPTKRLNA